LALANSARLSLLATTVWILAASCGGHALAQPTDDIDTTEVEIDALRADIRAIQARLTAQEEQRDTLQDELRESEQLISRVDQDLDMLVSQQRALEEDWARLTAETDRLRDNQNALSAGIEASIQQLWVLQQGGGLRIWLGGQSPHQAARHLAYYQLIVEEQRTQLLAYQAGLSELEAHTRMVEDAEQKLATQAEAIAARRMQLTAQQESKQQTLADITNALREDEQALQVLLQNQERLNSLLSELKALAITPALHPEPFVTRKGLLPMPVGGKPANRFGAVRNADIRWRGWMIPTEQGLPVKAIHGGRVIFADWLRGQGLILVIDHGEGWLSLYAQNHSLLRKVGEQVDAGTVLGKTGNTGGSDTTGLYFEIRHNGEPVDPAEWLDS